MGKIRWPIDRPSHTAMRGYATEIMVYLAVHADGAATEQILDHLWPAERRHVTTGRFYTGVSNLRKILAASAGDDTNPTRPPDCSPPRSTSTRSTNTPAGPR